MYISFSLFLSFIPSLFAREVYTRSNSIKYPATTDEIYVLRCRELIYMCTMFLRKSTSWYKSAAAPSNRFCARRRVHGLHHDVVEPSHVEMFVYAPEGNKYRIIDCDIAL